MPVYRPRTRLVNFRLSEEEYQSLRETCARSGARSVSDYARSAVLTGSPAPVSVPAVLQPSCSDRWERLESLVQNIGAQVNELVRKETVASHG